MGWLLDYDAPGVRYQALTDILERQPDIPVIREARAALAHDALVSRLFGLQAPDAGWSHPGAANPTWQATADHLALLAEAGVSGRDERVATAADWALSQAQSPDGDFDLPGVFLWALLRLGYHDDPRVSRAIRRAAKSLVARGAPGAPVQRTAWDSLPALWALLQLPASERARGVEAAVQTALAEVERIDWTNVASVRLEFGFPHLGEPDLLFALRALAEAGRVREDQVKPGVAVLISVQNARGRWPLARNHADRLLIPAEAVGPESKWSTLNALRVLRATEPA